LIADDSGLPNAVIRFRTRQAMSAIDYPYQPTRPAVAFLESAPLSDDER